MTEQTTAETTGAATEQVSRDAANWAQPVAKLTVEGERPGALNLNVDGKGLTGPLQGFGAMWQKTYRVSLTGAAVTPEEVMAYWKAHLPELMPADSRFYPSMIGVKPGEVVLISATLPSMFGAPAVPVSTGVLILYADDESFSVMTPDGHPESGFNTFSALDEDGVTVCQIQSLARANDPIYEFGFRFMGGGAQQEQIWRHVLTQLAQHWSVEPAIDATNVPLTVTVTVLFDEAMYHVIARTVPEVVTVSMAVDYKSPGFEGHRLICEAWVEKREGRRIEVSSALVDASTKKVVAEARAVYREVDLKRIIGR